MLNPKGGEGWADLIVFNVVWTAVVLATYCWFPFGRENGYGYLDTRPTLRFRFVEAIHEDMAAAHFVSG